MLERLIDKSAHTALSRALERSLQEAGVAAGVAQVMCPRLLSRPQEDDEFVDAAAAAALDVEDEEDLVANSTAFLPSAAPATPRQEGGKVQPPTVDELMAWMMPALEEGATWPDIAEGAPTQGMTSARSSGTTPDRR